MHISSLKLPDLTNVIKPLNRTAHFNIGLKETDTDKIKMALVYLETKKLLANIYKDEEAYIDSDSRSFINDAYIPRLHERISSSYDNEAIGTYFFEEALSGFKGLNFRKGIDNEYLDRYLRLAFSAFCIFYDIENGGRGEVRGGVVSTNEFDDVGILQLYTTDDFIIKWEESLYVDAPEDVTATLQMWFHNIACSNGVQHFYTREGTALYLGGYLAYNLLLMLAVIFGDAMFIFKCEADELTNLATLFRRYLEDDIKYNELATLVNRMTLHDN